MGPRRGVCATQGKTHVFSYAASLHAILPRRLLNAQTIGREQRDTVAGRRRCGVVRGNDGGSATDCPACMQPVLSLLPACARTVPSVPPACFQRVHSLHAACSLSDMMRPACCKATSRPPPAYMSVLVAHCRRLATHHVEVQRGYLWGAWTVLVAHGERLGRHHVQVFV